MKILLVNPPFVEAYGQYKAAAKVGAQPQMPLGLCYIGAVLENKGHQMQIIDADVEGMSIEDILTYIKTYRPDVFGVTGTTPIYASARKLLSEAKQANPQMVTIMGGFHLTALPAQTMNECSGADYGIIGEGEETIAELMDAIEQKKPVENIAGIAYRRKDRQAVINPVRPPIDGLESIPFPARHLLKMDKYIWSVPGKGMVPVTSIITQRGCPFGCIFCGVNTMFPGKTRYRQLDSILNEIEQVLTKTPATHFMVCDDTLTLNKPKVLQMCDEVKKRHLKFTFEGYTHASTVTKDILARLQEIGLVRLSFGVETGNQKILKAINKGVTLEQIRQAYQWCYELGMETRCSLMIGHPFETKETIQETIELAKSLKCYQAYINITTPYPGSKLYHMAKEGFGGLRLLTDDWIQYRRYGNAVMEMNDLSVQDLIEYQRIAYKKFYMRPHIIWYNVKRAGFKAAMVNSLAFVKSVLMRQKS
ncbi:MAG: radical SAM protein [Candidatus Schekmanbacteria bacterium]|nr:radical SAM protein [Candidatus Schekmanbacteria bacterium]